jgi:hypothetical protein
VNKYGEALVNVFGKNRKLDVPGDAKVAQRYCFINQRVINALHTSLVYTWILNSPLNVHSSAWSCDRPSTCGPRQLISTGIALRCTRGWNHRSLL